MVIDMGCGICLHLMLVSLTNQSADFSFSPFLLANVLFKEEWCFHSLHVIAVTCARFKNFCPNKISVGSHGHSSNSNIPWARHTLAASSVQMHSSCKKRNNVVFLLMLAIREAGKLSSGFFKNIFYRQRKYQAKAVKKNTTVLVAMA